MSTGDGWKSPAAIIGVATVVVAILAIVVPLLFASGKTDAPSGGIPLTSATASAQASPTPDASGSAISATGSPTVTAQEYESLLTQLRPVDTGYKAANNDGAYRIASASVNGVTYPSAVRMVASRGCANYAGGKYWVEYSIDRKWAKFVSTVGLTDEATSTAQVTYTIYADGKSIATGTARVGQSAPINVDVSGALRLRLEMQNPTAAIGERCRDDNHEAVLAWGTPTLTR